MHGSGQPRLLVPRSVVLTAAVGLAACGTGQGTAAGFPTTATAAPWSSESPSSSPAPPASSTPTGELASLTAPAGKPLSVRGRVTEGVEHNCLVLQASGATYQLVGPAARQAPRERDITVDGVLLEDRISFCQQGALLHVVRIR